MTSEPLAFVLRMTPEYQERLVAEGTLFSVIDMIYAGNTWQEACVAAIGESADWLRGQVGEHEHEALIPNLVGDREGPQARAAFLAQSTAAAAAGAWAAEDETGCLRLARRAAHWWSLVDGLDDLAPSAAPRPLATLADSLRAERAAHNPGAWAPVEDMVLHAANPHAAGLPATLRTEAQTWIDEPTGIKPAKLVLEIVAKGQPGLWRAPQAGLTLTDEAFLAALQDAWAWATTAGGVDSSISVRWQLLHSDESRASRGNGDAIGLACAVGLHQLAIRRHRLQRLDRHTSYLAAATPDGTVKVPKCQVSPVRQEHLRRLVVARAQPAPAGGFAVRRADVVKDAIAHGRQPVKAWHHRLMAGACALAVVTSIAGFAVARSDQSDSRNRAAASAYGRQAEAATLASDAQAALNTDPPRAIVAAAAAYRLAPHDQAVIDAVIAAAAADPRALHYLSPAGTVEQLSLSSDGELLAALLADGRIEVWNIAARAPRVLLIRHSPGMTSAIGFVGSGASLAAVGTAVTILDPLTGVARRLGTSGSVITAISASSRQNAFVTASAAGVRIWDSETGTSRTLSDMPAAAVSLAPNGLTVLVGSDSGALRLMRTAGGTAASTKLPSAVNSVLLGPTGNAYAVTEGGELYGLAANLRPASSIAIPPDTTLALRPGARQSELTPDGLLKGYRQAEVVAAASNAAILLPDDPAQIATGSGSSRDFNAVALPVRGMGKAAFATDSNGRLAATVLADGQVRISTIDLADGPPVQVQDVASGAIVNSSTLAVTTGLLYPNAIAALVNRKTGEVTALKHFTHVSTNIFERPVTTADDVVATGSPASSLDIWRISGSRLITVASNLTVAHTPITGVAVDDVAKLLFVAANPNIEVRQLASPTRQLTQISTGGRVACLTAVPARRTLYACTSRGIMAYTYTASGQLRDARIVDTSVDVLGLSVSANSQVLISFANGNAALFPVGFGPLSSHPRFTITTNDSYTLSAVLTSTVALISGRIADLLFYSTSSGAQILENQLGGDQFITTLWPGDQGTIGGATLDGSLFTLPSTQPTLAVRVSCAQLSDPSADWRNNFGGTPTAAQLPSRGGC